MGTAEERNGQRLDGLHEDVRALRGAVHEAETGVAVLGSRVTTLEADVAHAAAAADGRHDDHEKRQRKSERAAALLYGAIALLAFVTPILTTILVAKFAGR